MNEIDEMHFNTKKFDSFCDLKYFHNLFLTIQLTDSLMTATLLECRPLGGRRYRPHRGTDSYDLQPKPSRKIYFIRKLLRLRITLRILQVELYYDSRRARGAIGQTKQSAYKDQISEKGAC